MALSIAPCFGDIHRFGLADNHTAVIIFVCDVCNRCITIDGNGINRSRLLEALGNGRFFHVVRSVWNLAKVDETITVRRGCHGTAIEFKRAYTVRIRIQGECSTLHGLTRSIDFGK